MSEDEEACAFRAARNSQFGAALSGSVQRIEDLQGYLSLDPLNGRLERNLPGPPPRVRTGPPRGRGGVPTSCSRTMRPETRKRMVLCGGNFFDVAVDV